MGDSGFDTVATDYRRSLEGMHKKEQRETNTTCRDCTTSPWNALSDLRRAFLEKLRRLLPDGNAAQEQPLLRLLSAPFHNCLFHQLVLHLPQLLSSITALGSGSCAPDDGILAGPPFRNGLFLKGRAF